MTFLRQCRFKSGHKIWPKPSKTACKPCKECRQGTMPRITNYSSSGTFLRGNFPSCETDGAQQGHRNQQFSNKVNGLHTRLEKLKRAQGTRRGSYSIIGGHLSVRLCFDLLAVPITVGLRFGLLPAFSFTISRGAVVLLRLMSRSSRRPFRELLWRIDSGATDGLEKHLMKNTTVTIR